MRPSAQQLDVAVAQAELSRWLTDTRWLIRGDACQRVLGSDALSVQRRAGAMFGSSAAAVQMDANFLLARGASGDASWTPTHAAAQVAANVAQAKVLAAQGTRLAPALAAVEEQARCHGWQKILDRTVHSLAAWAPDAVGAGDREAVRYGPRTGAQLQQMELGLPQRPELPPLRLASLERKERLAPGDGDEMRKVGAGRIDERVLFPGGKMVRKTMRVSSGEGYTLHQADAGRAGAHGKVHRATAEDAGEEALIVKQQRSLPKRRPGVGQLPTELHDMLERTARAAEATQRIDTALTRQPELFVASGGALRGLGANVNGAALRDHFVDEFGKYYQVMGAMDGDLVDLHRTLRAELFYGETTPRRGGAHPASDGDGQPAVRARQVRLSVAAQSFVQLAGMHAGHFGRDRGIAHRDLKLSNILFSRQGGVRLIDFDEAQVLGKLGLRRAPYEQQGTLLSPEMHLPQLREVKRVLGKPNDVWALGASLLDLGFDEALDAPWSASPVGQDRKPATGTGTKFALYTAWHAAVVAGRDAPTWHDGKLPDALAQQIAEAAAPLLPTPTKASSAQLVQAARQLHAFFVDRHQGDPELTVLLLQRALVPQPERRATAKQLSAALVQRMGALNDRDRRLVVHLFAEAGAHRPKQAPVEAAVEGD